MAQTKLLYLIPLLLLIMGCSFTPPPSVMPIGMYDNQGRLVINSTIVNNASTPLITEEYLFLVAMGEVPNAKLVHKFGRHSDVTTNIEPVSLSGNYRTPTTAKQLQVFSSDVDDNIAGVGGRKILIQGLNSTWQEVEVEVELNGVTPVTIPINFTRVYRTYLTESGVYANQIAGSHEGTITIEDVNTGEDWAIINVDDGLGLGQSQIGVYSIEKGCEGYLLSKYISTDTVRTLTAYFFQRQGINETTAPFNTMRLVEQEDGITSTIAINPKGVVRTFPELTDVGFMAKTTQGTAAVSVDFEILLICDHIVQ